MTYRARRAAKEAKEAPAQPAPAKVKVEVKKFVKIGRPGYKGKLAAWLIISVISVILFVVHRDVSLTVNVLCFNIWDMCFFFFYSNQTEGPRDWTAVLTFPGQCFLFTCTSFFV